LSRVVRPAQVHLPYIISQVFTSLRRAESWMARQRSQWEQRLDQLDAHANQLQAKQEKDS
jgi:hypothetical protein